MTLMTLLCAPDPLRESGQLLRIDGFASGFVGLTLGDSSLAYPYAELYDRPIILQADREKKMILIWSAYANRAVCRNVSRELRGREKTLGQALA